MKRTLLILAVLMMSVAAKAQNIMDIYDYSSSFYQGTAKSAGMANAIGAVGEDFSSVSINPAGIGLARHASLIFTPGLSFASTNSMFNGSYNSELEVRVPFNNIGLTLVFPQNNNVLKSVNLGIGMNRLNNQGKESYASGMNFTSSLVDAYFLDMENYGIANANDLESFSPSYIFPLYQTYVIGGESGANIYETSVPQGNLNQQRGVLKNGYTNEISISLGFNLSDKWFLGASLDIPRLYRYMVSDYKEVNKSSNTAFNNFLWWTQEEVISTNGWGVGGKFGIIGFPARWLRFGLSIHTPTLYRVNESWKTSTRAQYRNTSHNNAEYNTGTKAFSYKLQTPFRFDASLAFIFGSNGMLTFDYEFVNYRNAMVSSRDYDYTYLNSGLSREFSATSNFRVGGEYRVKSVCFRAGYAFYGSPYGLGKRNLMTNSISAGIGHTIRFFTIDAAYVYSRTPNSYYIYAPYSNYIPDGDDVAANTISEVTNLHQLIVSLKFKLN